MGDSALRTGPWSAPPRPAETTDPWQGVVLAGDDDLTPELDRALTGAAAAARAGDAAARAALHAALAAKIDRFATRYLSWTWSRSAPRRDGRLWDGEDLVQEGFVILVDLVAAWPGGDSFGSYFFAHFPWRLQEAARRLFDPRGREVVGHVAETRLTLLQDGSAAAAEALAQLEAIAAALPPSDADLLRWRLRDGEAFAPIALRLGVDRRTVYRRWTALLAELRGSFEGDGLGPPAGSA